MELERIDAYCDLVPRAVADAARVGRFEVFVARAAGAHPFYARPARPVPSARGVDEAARAVRYGLDEVREVLEWQRRRGLEPSIEWIDEVTPGLREIVVEVVGEAQVELCRLLALGPGEGSVPSGGAAPASGRVEVLRATSPRLADVAGAVAAAFAGADEAAPQDVAQVVASVESGDLIVAGAFDEGGRAVGGASASPREGVAEITGIGVLPGARRRGLGEALTRALIGELRARGVDEIFLSAASDGAAALYRRIGFVRVGTACIARGSAAASVRRLDEGDAAVFRDVRLRALADAPDAFGVRLAEVVDRPDSEWIDRLTGPGPVFAAYDGETAVGMGGVFPRPEEGRAMIWGMWVDPAARGRGHARRLLATLVEWVREAGFPEVELHVTEGNEAARRLYVAEGFVPTGAWEPLREGSPLQIETLRRRL